MSRAVLLFSSGGALLVAFVAAMVSSAIVKDQLPPIPSGPNVFEGVVADGPTARSPIGDPIAYGYVEIGNRYRVGKSWRVQPLLREIRGYEDLVIETGDGAHTIRLTDPMTQLRDFRSEYVEVPTLEGHPEAPKVPNWQAHMGRGGFAVRVLAVRRGERVLVVLDEAGALQEVWKGGLAYQVQRREEMAAFGQRLVLGMRLFAGLAVLVCLILAAAGLFRG